MDDMLIPLGTRHPDSCPECDDILLLVNGQYGVYYRCINFPSCEGTASAHADGKPLGTAEPKHVKTKRQLAHVIFRNMVEVGGFHKQKLEEWLTKRVGTSHFSQMNERQISRAVREIQRYVKA